jgi:hypothetical protein
MSRFLQKPEPGAWVAKLGGYYSRETTLLFVDGFVVSFLKQGTNQDMFHVLIFAPIRDLRGSASDRNQTIDRRP